MQLQVLICFDLRQLIVYSLDSESNKLLIFLIIGLHDVDKKWVKTVKSNGKLIGTKGIFSTIQ